MHRFTALFIIFVAFTACTREAPGLPYEQVPSHFEDATQVIFPNYDLCGSWVWELINQGEEIFLNEYVGDIIAMSSHPDSFDGLTQGMVTFDNIPAGVTKAILRFSAEGSEASYMYPASFRKVSYDGLEFSFQGPYSQTVDLDPVHHYFDEQINTEISRNESIYFYVDVTELLDSRARLQFGILLTRHYDPMLIQDIELALFYD